MGFYFFNQIIAVMLVLWEGFVPMHCHLSYLCILNKCVENKVALIIAHKHH